MRRILEILLWNSCYFSCYHPPGSWCPCTKQILQEEAASWGWSTRSCSKCQQSHLRWAPLGFPLKKPLPAGLGHNPAHSLASNTLSWFMRNLQGDEFLYSSPRCCFCGIWVTAPIRAAFGKQTGFYPSSGSNPHECWHVLTSTNMLAFRLKQGVPGAACIFYILSFCDWANFPLLSWVSGLGNCIFSFSYCRGTTEWKSQACFPSHPQLKHN